MTVSFTSPAVTPDLLIAEYAGLDRVDPLVAAPGGQGSGALSDSGRVTTTDVHNLLVAATLAQTATDAGSGFTKRLPAGGLAGVTYVRDTMIDASGNPLWQRTRRRSAGRGSTTRAASPSGTTRPRGPTSATDARTTWPHWRQPTTRSRPTSPSTVPGSATRLACAAATRAACWRTPTKPSSTKRPGPGISIAGMASATPPSACMPIPTSPPA